MYALLIADSGCALTLTKVSGLLFYVNLLDTKSSVNFFRPYAFNNLALNERVYGDLLMTQRDIHIQKSPNTKQKTTSVYSIMYFPETCVV